MAGKQAKVIGDDELAAVLAACDATRYPLRNRAVVLLSFKAGLRAMEIAKVRRHMVLDARGKLDTCLRLEDKICKKGSGRIVPMPAGELLHRTLADLLAAVPGPPRDPLILSERAEEDKWTKQMMDDPRPMDPKSIIRLFQRLYRKVGLIGCSSHSGRRTYITRMARALVQIPGSSLRDVQYIAGHANLTTTQRYIEHNPDVLDRLARLV